MAHADMAEGVEHTFVGKHAVGERDLIADIGEIFGHGHFLLLGLLRGRMSHFLRKTGSPLFRKMLRAAHGVAASCATKPKWLTLPSSAAMVPAPLRAGRGQVQKTHNEAPGRIGDERMNPVVA